MTIVLWFIVKLENSVFVWLSTQWLATVQCFVFLVVFIVIWITQGAANGHCSEWNPSFIFFDASASCFLALAADLVTLFSSTVFDFSAVFFCIGVQTDAFADDWNIIIISCKLFNNVVQIFVQIKSMNTYVDLCTLLIPWRREHWDGST